MGAHLAWKLGLGTAGTLVALASDPIGWPWLFPVGLGLVVLALLLPAHEGQTWREKWSNLLRHLPGGRIVASRDESTPEEDAERSR